MSAQSKVKIAELRAEQQVRYKLTERERTELKKPQSPLRQQV